jgi:hypothetical protein
MSARTSGPFSALISPSAMGYKRIGQSKFALPSLPRTAIVATRSSLDGNEKVAEIEA